MERLELQQPQELVFQVVWPRMARDDHTHWVRRLRSVRKARVRLHGQAWRQARRSGRHSAARLVAGGAAWVAATASQGVCTWQMQRELVVLSARTLGLAPDAPNAKVDAGWRPLRDAGRACRPE